MIKKVIKSDILDMLAILGIATSLIIDNPSILAATLGITACALGILAFILKKVSKKNE